MEFNATTLQMGTTDLNSVSLFGNLVDRREVTGGTTAQGEMLLPRVNRSTSVTKSFVAFLHRTSGGCLDFYHDFRINLGTCSLAKVIS